LGYRDRYLSEWYEISISLVLFVRRPAPKRLERASEPIEDRWNLVNLVLLKLALLELRFHRGCGFAVLARRHRHLVASVAPENGGGGHFDLKHALAIRLNV